ncbi:YybS family protein [Alkalicoccobacillus porphyridii]|uniref:DUF2232 domain-containing protein n=1 Tax=Alkalicoccobacillus porphyridii TaxID=2597270 RepID=A0A554A1E4_9BACI|nr:DUF2232 domain-containing protein [Alkalicoccobacillus porphyridii]TSB47522.1 DUF2232 domain-containing protein [Alkalicoccobacillus porphyridii]
MNHTSPWKEGTLITGIYLLLLLVVLAVPIVNIIVVWALPLPLAYFASRHELKKSLVLYLLLCMISWPIHTLGLLVTLVFALAGVVTGELHRRKADGFAVLRGVSLTYTLFLTMAYVWISVLSDMTINQLVRSQREQVTDLLQVAGQSQEQIDLVTDGMNQIPYIVPFLIVFFATMMALVTVWLIGILLRKYRMDVKRLPAFKNWGFPKVFIWVYLIVFVLILSNPEEGSTLFIAVTNIYLLVNTIMMIQGLSFVFFFFDHKKYPKVFGVIVIFMTILLAPLQLVVRLIGIADMVLDLKSRLGSQRK